MGHGNKSRKGWVIAILIFSAFICSLLGQRIAGPLRSAAQLVLAPLGDGTMYLATSAKRQTEQVGLRSISPDEARRLSDENDLLRARIQWLAQERRELLKAFADVQGLRQQLYAPSEDFPCELIRGRIIGSESLPYGRNATLNVGSSAGAVEGSHVTTRGLLTDRAKELPPNLAVMSAEALVGRVSAAGPFTARLQLVSDRAFRISALLWRDPARPREIVVRGPSARKEPLTAQNNVPVGPVEARGDGMGGLEVTGVIATHGVLEGDWLLTRQDQEFLPAGVVIGKVTAVQDDPANPGMKVLNVRPHADLVSLRDVYIVLPLAVPDGRGRRGS